MPRTTTMTVRVPERVLARLEVLAKATDRTKAYLASRAIEEYVDVQEWQVRAIEEGVREADSAEAVFVEQDEVEARLAGRAASEKKRAKR